MYELLLRKLQSGELAGLEGTAIESVLQLREDFLNEAAALGKPDNVEQLQLALLPDNRLRIDLVARAPVVGRVRREIEGYLVPDSGLPRRAILQIRIEKGLGFMDRALLKLFQSMIAQQLPPGIQLDNDEFAVDLQQVTAGTPAAALLPYLTSLQWYTEPGRICIQYALKV